MSAPRPYGVLPLAARPIATSSAPTTAADSAPLSCESSASSTAEERVRTAGDMGDHPPLRQVEGRDELRGVEDREPARGSRAEVMDPATPAETVDGDVNERSKILEHLRDGVDGDAVVLGEEPEHLHRRERVERHRRVQSLLRGGERIRRG